MKQMKAKKTKSPNLSEVYHNFTSKGLGFFSLFFNQCPHNITGNVYYSNIMITEAWGKAGSMIPVIFSI